MANTIKRNSKSIVCTAKLDTNCFKKGDCVFVRKNDGAFTGTNNRTGEKFRIMLSHLRNENIFSVDLQWDY